MFQRVALKEQVGIDEVADGRSAHDGSRVFNCLTIASGDCELRWSFLPWITSTLANSRPLFHRVRGAVDGVARYSLALRCGARSRSSVSSSESGPNESRPGDEGEIICPPA